MKIELHVTSVDIDHMIHTRMASFYHDQPDRFDVPTTYDEADNEIPFPQGGSFLWFDNAVERLIVENWYYQQEVATISLIDNDDNNSSWCLWIEEDFDATG